MQRRRGDKWSDHHFWLFNALPMQYCNTAHAILKVEQCNTLRAVHSVTLRPAWDDVRPGGVIKLSLQVSIHLRG